MKGLFITFEGAEGAGKTSQLQLLFQHLSQQGYPVEQTREPGGTRIGRNIRKILLDNQFAEMDPYCEVLLYAADRAQHVAEKVLPAIKRGRIVLSDRFVDASIVYQGYGRGIDLEFVRKVNSLAIKGCKPDITFFLDISPEEGLRRVRDSRKADRIEEEDLEFHRRIQKGYHSLAEEEQERYIVLDASSDIEAIHQRVTRALNPLLLEYSREEEGLK